MTALWQELIPSSATSAASQQLGTKITICRLHELCYIGTNKISATHAELSMEYAKGGLLAARSKSLTASSCVEQVVRKYKH